MNIKIKYFKKFQRFVKINFWDCYKFLILVLCGKRAYITTFGSDSSGVTINVGLQAVRKNHKKWGSIAMRFRQ
jgi:hypothetical protein